MENLEKALVGMRTSLALLDAGEVPADIGAHLDLAICRLEDYITKHSERSCENR